MNAATKAVASAPSLVRAAIRCSVLSTRLRHQRNHVERQFAQRVLSAATLAVESAPLLMEHAHSNTVCQSSEHLQEWKTDARIELHERGD
jgi:hypothetical protein